MDTQRGRDVETLILIVRYIYPLWTKRQFHGDPNLWTSRASAVLIAVIISAQVTRETFGYSFATWRFHLRGETIRSAVDVGWMRDLTVRQMMLRGLPTASADLPASTFRKAFPLGSARQVAALGWLTAFAMILALTADLTILRPTITFLRTMHAKLMGKVAGPQIDAAQ